MSSYGGFGRGGQRRWTRLSELRAHEHIAAFQEAHATKGESLSAYCERTGIQRQALAEAIRFRLPELADALIGPRPDAGKKGVKFEYALKGMMERRGYYVIRQYGSRSPFDLLAFGRDKPTMMIQAKKDGKLYFNDWNALCELAVEYGCWPVLAQRPTDGSKGALWFRLAGPKARKGIRNDGMLIPFDPRDPHQDSLLASAVAV